MYSVLGTCNVLTNPTNGKVSCSLREDKVPTDGDTCNYTCNTDYVLRGDVMRTCGSDGRWTGSKPKCIGNVIKILYYLSACNNCRHLFRA